LPGWWLHNSGSGSQGALPTGWRLLVPCKCRPMALLSAVVVMVGRAGCALGGLGGPGGGATEVGLGVRRARGWPTVQAQWWRLVKPPLQGRQPGRGAGEECSKWGHLPQKTGAMKTMGT
jgi:hypothetical protein